MPDCSERYECVLQEKRRLAINNAKRQWEAMQGSILSRTGKLVRAPDLYANHLGSLPAAHEMFANPYPQDDDTELVSVTRYLSLSFFFLSIKHA
jgi:hypothetical protein